MPRKNGSATKRTTPGERRFTYVTSVDLGQRIEDACIRSNASISTVIDWCVERLIAEYERKHPRPSPGLRPGSRIKIQR